MASAKTIETSLAFVPLVVACGSSSHGPATTNGADGGVGRDAAAECGCGGGTTSNPPPLDIDANLPPATEWETPGDDQVTIAAHLVEAQDVVRDPVQPVAYVSVSDADPQYPGQVVAYSTDTGEPLFAVPVGSNPRRLAVSDDGSKLYVSLNGTPEVVRVDLASQSVDLNFPIESTFIGLYPGDLAVIAGSPGTVAVARMTGQDMYFVQDAAIFDEGVMRPDTTTQYSNPAALEATELPTLVYGLDFTSTGYTISTLTVTATGFNETLTTPYAVLDQPPFADFVYQSGHLFSTSGVMVDGTDHTRLGTYGVMGPIVPDTPFGKVYIAVDPYTDTLDPIRIAVFDLDTFVPLDSVPLSGIRGRPVRMVRGVSDGFAAIVDRRPFTGDPARWIVFAHGPRFGG